MPTLSELIKAGFVAYDGLSQAGYPSQNHERFKGFEVKASKTPLLIKSAGHSNYNQPIDRSSGRLSGYGRGWGQADANTQAQVMNLIVESSKDLTLEDQAILLAIARIESGFNPDAAATTTSASGVFQLIRKTATNLGLSQKEIFDAQKNITAAVDLFSENVQIVNRRYPKLSGHERAVMLYALHHDGPGLNYGGEKIARKELVPYLKQYRATLEQ